MKHRIAIGSVYAAVGAWQSRWQVREIIEKPGYPDHVRLQSLSEAGDERLIAVAALLDRSKFVLESAPQPEPGSQDAPPGTGGPQDPDRTG